MCKKPGSTPENEIGKDLLTTCSNDFFYLVYVKIVYGYKTMKLGSKKYVIKMLFIL